MERFLTIGVGMTVERVEELLGEKLVIEQECVGPYKNDIAAFEDKGVTLVFKPDTGRLDTIKFEAPFNLPVEGVRIGDTKDTVKEKKGVAPRIDTSPHYTAWIYGNPNDPDHILYDFEKTRNGKCVAIFPLSKNKSYFDNDGKVITLSGKDYEDFASKYDKTEKEILILTSDDKGGAGSCGAYWEASMDFLAYVDVAANELKTGDGQVVWPNSEEEQQVYGFRYPHNFKPCAIYRLKVRELTDKTVPPGRLPSAYNCFMVIEVLEENAHNDELLAILAEYTKPVVITDKAFGEFVLDKQLSMFSGKINWLGKDIPVSLDVSIDNKGSWTKALNALRALSERQEQQDSDLRDFAAQKLTGLANDWIQDENAAEITQKDFVAKISLSELTVTSSGNYKAYFDDADMFAGHTVTVSGSIKKGIKSAEIEG